ncbi:MAG: signal peptidase II [Oscillospiraceae bacterium]|nr:signal peptidase II [Oscillospiraceae bacterium]
MTKKRGLLLALFMALAVAADQITKALVRAKLPYGAAAGDRPLIPGVIGLTWVENEGAAWSMLSGMRWLFLALVVVFFVAVAVLIRKKWITKPAELWCLAAIGGGALGNGIDRALRGTVTDMLQTLFMRFPVFNVADCFITCGAIALIVYVLFWDRKTVTEGPKDAG